jgi:hypothetical protein
MSVKNHFNFIDQWYFYQCCNALIDCNVTDLIRIGRPVRGEQGVCMLIPPMARISMYQSGFVTRSVCFVE